MKAILRLVTVAAVAVTGLALAGNALATQKLSVTQSASSLTIRVTQTANDPQPARINIYVPAGYTLNTSAAPGTNIGTTQGQVFARDQNIPLPLTGDVIVAKPSDFTTNACSPGLNQAVWVLRLSVAGQTISIPVYVNSTAGQETALGSAKLTVCLAPSDTPQGSPGRSPFGAQLLSAVFTVNNIFTPPVGAARWTSFWTPYAAGNGVPNAAGTVEARAFTGPAAVTIAGRVTDKKKHIVRLTGRVSFAGLPIGVAQVRLSVNGKLQASGRTNANGNYSFTLRKTRGKVRTFFFQTRAISGERDVTATGCASPTQPGVACVSATASAFNVVSPKLKIRV